MMNALPRSGAGILVVVSLAACQAEVVVEGPGQGSELDPGTLVKDLAEAEARTWCERYVNRPAWWAPSLAEASTFQQGGYVYGYASLCCFSDIWPTEGACVMHPRIDDCIANLRRVPCEATLSQLDDCVASYYQKECTPGDSGCEPFAHAPSCEEVVIHPIALQPSNQWPYFPGIRVE